LQRIATGRTGVYRRALCFLRWISSELGSQADDSPLYCGVVWTWTAALLRTAQMLSPVYMTCIRSSYVGSVPWFELFRCRALFSATGTRKLPVLLLLPGFSRHFLLIMVRLDKLLFAIYFSNLGQALPSGACAALPLLALRCSALAACCILSYFWFGRSDCAKRGVAGHFRNMRPARERVAACCATCSETRGRTLYQRRLHPLPAHWKIS